jgi:phosphoglycolate phosphatase
MPGWTTRLVDPARNVIPFDLIVFDFDGTIADSADGIAQCMAAAFELSDLPPPSASDVRRRIGLTLEESIRQLTSGRLDVDIAAVARRYRELHASIAAPAVRLFPGTIETLERLREKHLRLVVVSQKARRGLVDLITRLEIDHYFDLVLGSDDVTSPKPHSALYGRHIEPRYSDLPLHRVLVVGDTATDLQFAANIGVSSCWAEYGYGEERDCRAWNPTYTIPAFAALTPLCGCAAS